MTLATTEYGETFASAVQQGNVLGVQFHPEKSQAAGLRLIDNFARLVERGAMPRPAASAVRGNA